MPETEHFINDGYGWSCKRCRESEGTVADAPSSVADAASKAATLPRFFREGEAEEREPRLSSTSLARWKNETQRTLLCARCGVEEEMVR